jgi:hypothetical protein
MNVYLGVGLRHYDAVQVLTETNSESVIDRFKERNFTIAVVTGIIIAVASTALFIFGMIKYGIPEHKVDRIQNINTAGQQAIAILGTIFGSIALLPAAGFGTWALTEFLLDRYTVEPLRDLKRKIDLFHRYSPDQPLLCDEYLKLLIKKCDFTAQQRLIGRMNFEQLAIARPILGIRKFKNLLEGYNHQAALQWKMIVHFEQMSPEKKLEYIDRETGNQEFRTMLETNPNALKSVREVIGQQNKETKAKLITQHDLLSGIVDREEKIQLVFSNGTLTLPKEWALETSLLLKSLSEDSHENTISMPAEANLERIAQCFNILWGNEEFPNHMNDIQEITFTGKFYNIPGFTLKIAHALIEKTRSNHISKEELIDWLTLHLEQSDEPEYQEIRMIALIEGGLTEVQSEDQFRKIWPLTKNLSELRPIYLNYYQTCLQNSKSFRSVYEMALELQDDSLKDLCLQALRSADANYKDGVKELFLSSRIPDDVYPLLVS